MDRAAHANVRHWDDVGAEVVDAAELRLRRWRLGAAAGAFRAGVNRVQVEPGARSSPAHCHADEEELFFVLGGTGLVWLDGTTHPVGGGDVVCHRVHEEAHTLIAGPAGLDVLAFGPQSEQNVTWLPHAGVMRVGPHWVPLDAPHPYEAEGAAGPLPLPDAPAPTRPGTIRHLDAIERATQDRPGFELDAADLGRATGSVTTGLNHVVLRPGSQNFPLHRHTAQEELFVVLDGDGEALLGDAAFPVRRGSVVARPPAGLEAHAFRAGPSGLTYLAWGTRDPADLVYYPSSQKLGIRGLKFRIEPLDYWDGE